MEEDHGVDFVGFELMKAKKIWPPAEWSAWNVAAVDGDEVSTKVLELSPSRLPLEEDCNRSFESSAMHSAHNPCLGIGNSS